MDGHTEARKIKLQTLRWRKEKRTFEQKQIVLLLRMCGLGPGLLTVGSPQTERHSVSGILTEPLNPRGLKRYQIS